MPSRLSSGSHRHTSRPPRLEYDSPKRPRALTGQHRQITVFNFDAGKDVRAAFALSGETEPPLLRNLLHHPPPPAEKVASEIAAINRAKRSYQEAYLAYWNSTVALTGTGRPVDGFFSSVTPYAAARPTHLNYPHPSLVVNVLDYSAVVIPVTRGNKKLDIADPGYTPLSAIDKEVQDLCEFAE